MKKIVLKQDGKEVKMGDKLIKHCVINDPNFGKSAIAQEIILDENTLPKLVKAGVLVYDDGHTECACMKSEVSMDLDFYIEKIAKRMNWKVDKVYNYLNNVYSILPSAAFSMILREIAIELDKKYDNHIQDSPEIFVFSLCNGRITKVDKAQIKSYKNFAAFRSINDAKIAYRIIEPILKKLFKSISEK